ncbi:MAG: hypothetical protein DRI61_00315 [Chloroflexi bacterium]|nr:MAG: hypothetical protein DRI61_00315 [Chloroflexota bacterium]
MNILILGVAGVLGSSLADHFIKQGHNIRGIDITRREEAWRIDNIHKVQYIWKSTSDILLEDLKDIDIVFNCSIGVADRPLGNYSPRYTLESNLIPEISLLETLRRSKIKVIIYPSSFNALYGYRGVYSEITPICPVGVYGWTKGAIEELYLTYHRQYSLPVIVTRVGSAYGPKMRSDELIGRLIIYFLKDKVFHLRSPESKRLWTFSYDVLSFYDNLLDKFEECIGSRLVCAGNKGDRILSNTEVAEIIKKIVGKGEYVPVEYEPGELINGKPISFSINPKLTRDLLGWSPQYSLEEGLRLTTKWFRENLWRYNL